MPAPGSLYYVKDGDTLYSIANDTFSDPKTAWKRIGEVNGLSVSRESPVAPYVAPGTQISLDISGTTPEEPKEDMMKAVIDYFGLQSGTDRTMFVVWSWKRDETASYQVKWLYDSGDNIWFIGSNTTITDDGEDDTKQNLYTAPSNAKRVKVLVKPVSKTKKVNNVDTNYWTAEWSTEVTYDFSESPPLSPSAPSIDIDKYVLTATQDDLPDDVTAIEFEIVQDNSNVFNTGKADVVTGHASYACTVAAGSEYKVRCRAYKDERYSEWSGYSANIKTIPSVPNSIIECRADSKTSVSLTWEKVNSAETYDIEYATSIEYFDRTSSTQTVSTTTDDTSWTITGLDTGYEYFFRVRAVNTIGVSGWSEIKSTLLGRKPSPPTTWASSTTAMVGDTLNLYWVHNSEDNSKQKQAVIELTVNGNVQEITVDAPESDPDEPDKTSVYPIVLTAASFPEGAVIDWRVKTRGVIAEYSDYSIKRTVNVYAPVTLQLDVKNRQGTSVRSVTSFPFYVTALGAPATQTPITYVVSVVSNQYYETIDNTGRNVIVSEGDIVYSSVFNVRSLNLELSAFNIDLVNNMSYTVNCTVAMSSGLTASSSIIFTVSWAEVRYNPSIELGYDKESVSMRIRPYCINMQGSIVENVVMSVYRREFDGRFVEIISGLQNGNNTYVVDPHPSLDYARYRVVATDVNTGAISFYDAPGYPVQEKSAIIQWNDQWIPFDGTDSSETEHPSWSGLMLRLPYNIRVEDRYTQDVSLVNYIGRSRPVSYYGTQIGHKANWTMDIPKDDVETLYMLRRLASWQGNVYARELSGSGYWASINVNFSRGYDKQVVPVTLELTPVEGGM